jgi:L-threonylcarbamoyladenylate synthase
MALSPGHPAAPGAGPGLPPTALAERILAGSAALFPTDTLPALAARPEAAQQIWTLKARPTSKPLILMAADPEPLFRALEVPPLPSWLEVADRWWPGALTLVLPARGVMVAALQPATAGRQGSLGLRIPACEQALDLLRLTGPLATTSVNRSGDPPCLDAGQAAAAFPELPRLAPEPWPEPAGLPSTVIAWSPAGEWQVLRAGAVMPTLPIPPRP